MEPTLIRIDVKTIEKNPDDGRTEFSVLCSRTTMFRGIGSIPSYLKDEENCFLTNVVHGDECGEWDCCDVKYETAEEALLRAREG